MEKSLRSAWSGYGIALLLVALTLGILFVIPPLQQPSTRNLAGE